MLTTKKIEKVIKSNPTLKLDDYKRDHKFEELNSHGFSLSYFDNYIKRKGNIMSEAEFATKYLDDTVCYFMERTSRGEDAFFDKELHSAIIHRAIRSYRSYIYEVHAIARLRELFPNYIIAEHNLLDTLGGVDLVVADPATDKMFMVHISSASAVEKGSIEEKMTRPAYRKGKCFTRKYVEGSHFAWGYSAFNSRSIKGEVGVFTDKFLIEQVEKGLVETTAKFSENIELKYLNTWLKENTGEDLETALGK